MQINAIHKLYTSANQKLHYAIKLLFAFINLNCTVKLLLNHTRTHINYTNSQIIHMYTYTHVKKCIHKYI